MAGASKGEALREHIVNEESRESRKHCGYPYAVTQQHRKISCFHTFITFATTAGSRLRRSLPLSRTKGGIIC